MKTNGNQNVVSDYYIGLDVGTNSIGWAVSDENYTIPKFKGNAMWGVRLFDDAKTAEERRQIRTSRRLNNRKHQRIQWLNLLFDEEISKIDPSFFIRLKESSLCSEDKSAAAKYPLFNDDGYTDKDYYKSYPTLYHLRNELVSSAKPHDVRLVYLAIHHILKSRGHFLFDMDLGDNYKTLDVLLDDFNAWLLEEFEASYDFSNKKTLVEILSNSMIGITAKKKQLKENCNIINNSNDINLLSTLDLLSGATVKFCDLFFDDELKNAEKKSITLNSDVDADIDILSEVLGENRLEYILKVKELFDSAKLTAMLGNNQYICEAKVEQFNINKKDLLSLKRYVKANHPEKYKEIFSLKKEKLNNFAAYSKKTISSGEYTCNQEDFCKYLLNTLPELEKDEGYADIATKIKNNNFLPKLKGSDNSVIPNQLHKKELEKILENAAEYLNFLKKADEDGIAVKDKIISVFEFKIPYYVGPLNNKSPNSWVVRTKEKVYPWNFEKVVNVQESSQEFIIRLISKCSYTGDDVLPKESLLFSEYCVLNEINPLCINGEKIAVELKNEIFNELFVKSNKKVTKKAIKQYLLKQGYAKNEDEISGVDENIKSKLKSYHDFSKIIDVNSNRDMIEDIIRGITIFGADKKLFKSWLKNKYSNLTKEQVDCICRLKYKDWGSLSKKLLTDIYSADENGEAHSIIEMLYKTNNNLMQLLSSDYQYKTNADNYRLEQYGIKNNISDMIKDMYISPAIKRSLLQTVKIVDEIVDIKKSAPKKIFIEVAREKTEENQRKRTVSRKEKLLELYKNCKKEYPELYSALNLTDESNLRKDALYLYYTQFGKCMYSGKPIELEKLETDYDVDHIFPQSKIMDDSLDNRVLVCRKLNEEKTNTYPIKAEWRERMQSFWFVLKEKELISQKKYERLIRHTPLSDEELSSFVARQLVETRQSTKALAELFKSIYKNSKIVYSKAGNVSKFKQDFDIVKCREINDLHHAKDAYLNIVVGNVYDTKFTSAFFKNIRSENYSLNKVFEYDVKGAWEKEKTIVTVKNTVSKNNILVTRKPYEARGALFDLQILPAGKGQLPIKQGKSIEKYGGYNKVSGAFFFVAEHTHKSKRIRTIEPVYIYKKTFYETNPIDYCVEILGLVDPKIIYPRLLIDSPVEIDNKRVFICGRTGNRLLLKHDYQLALSQAEEKYIKEISKYVERSRVAGAAEGITLPKNSSISAENNALIYDMFCSKLQKPCYYRLFAGVYETLSKSKEKFITLSLIDQCRLLTEILKLFKCDRQSTDLTLIDASKNSGILLCNKSLKNSASCFAVHQSVTGLFEYKTNLLD